MLYGMTDLLDEVIKRYLHSGDFNGLYVDAETLDRPVASKLVEDGLVEVVAEEDFINPHIRPWPSRRSIESQVASIDRLNDETYGLCLYPKAQALKAVRTPKRYAHQPFSQAMAKGRGTLELAYFRFDVLEQYRNDPRFLFKFEDFGADATIGDEAFLDDEESEEDKTGLQHVGFAYDLSGYDPNDADSPIIRRVCVFYGDLAKLTPTHQQRWKTYQVDETGLHPHPVWMTQQMGHWPDGFGPFERLLFEMACLNELHERAFGKPLLRTTDRPRDFGWILRPSQHEWDTFIQQLDKLLSENLSHDALDLRGVPRKDDVGQNIGSLNRLAALLSSRGVSESAVKDVLKPLRDVRQARQRPAHALRANITDKTFVHKQVVLIERVTESLFMLRRFWQTHPKNHDWESRYGEPETQYRM